MIRLVKGFHDILPDETPKWAFIITAARSTLERAGFKELIVPIMERTELFERGIGEVTDIVEKEMYTFVDLGGESLSLRPEATAGTLRAVVEHSLLKREPVLKLYSIGPMFRRERPSKGRFRQFFQINAEVLGDDSPFTDAETIATAHSIMSNIGARELVMEINSVGCPECRPQFKQVLREFLSRHLDQLCDDCRRRYEINPLRILDCKVPKCAEIVQEAPLITDSLDERCRTHFDTVQRGLDLLEIPYRIEPRMVRGLDYYSRTAFEIIHTELGKTKAVGGGGRYDSLVKELGGPDVSGIGFAIGLERLSMGLADDDPRFAVSIDVYIAAIGEKVRETAFRLANTLRQAGISTDIRNFEMSLKAQMKLADRIGARKVILLGEDEMSRNEVVVRKMSTGEQTAVPIEEIVTYLQGDKS